MTDAWEQVKRILATILEVNPEQVDLVVGDFGQLVEASVTVIHERGLCGYTWMRCDFGSAPILIQIEDLHHSIVCNDSEWQETTRNNIIHLALEGGSNE